MSLGPEVRCREHAAGAELAHSWTRMAVGSPRSSVVHVRRDICQRRRKGHCGPLDISLQRRRELCGRRGTCLPWQRWLADLERKAHRRPLAPDLQSRSITSYIVPPSPTTKYPPAFCRLHHIDENSQSARSNIATLSWSRKQRQYL